MLALVFTVITDKEKTAVWILYVNIPQIFQIII